MASRTFLKTTETIVFLFVLLVASSAVEANIIYVDYDAPGSNNGSSWTDACNYLQDALAAAASGDEIRVAEGTYKPDQGGGNTAGDRDAAYHLINGVNLKGGYAGFGAPDPDARDIELYGTVLSGDLNGDDVGAMSDPSWDENSRHVLIGSNTDANTVLDGFTIKHGNADSGSQQYGGGMYNSKGDPTLINCQFIENFAGQSGGGLHNYICSPTLINCEFISNYATEQGGGVHSGSLTLINCRFTGNSAEYGGGISATGTTLNNCEFTENSADYGGAVSVLDRSTLTLNRCKFNGNHADYDGGAMWNWDAENGIAITNCIFVANSTDGYGGAIYNFSSNPVLKHCTFTENSSGSSGSGHAIASESSDYGSLTGCILWDGGYEIYDRTAYGTIITYSDVQGGWPGSNINANPCFVREPYDGGDGWGYGDNDDYGDLRLLPDSPCIDASDPNYVPGPGETDLDGNPRIVNDIVDMGAYESLTSGPGIRRVPAQYETIQAAMDAATDGEVVLVADGTYTGDGNRDIDFKGKAITVRSENGPQACIVDCEAQGRGFYLHNAESEYSILEGFTILNGVHDSGGGILCTDGASPTIRNNIIEGNRIPYDFDGGGGIACRNGASPLIVGNVIRNNYCEPGSGGGGIHCYKAGSPRIYYNVITGNHANGGGGIEIAYGTNGATIVGNLIVANDARVGGAIKSWAANCNLTILNNTIVGNVVEFTTGGIEITDTTNVAITNCIIWGNRDQNGTVESSQITGSSTNYCCIQGWTGAPDGVGNFDLNPLFVDAGHWDANGTVGDPSDDFWVMGDYHLLQNSPCIDAGDPNYVPGPNETDIDGNERIVNGIVDLGVYECAYISARVWYVDDSSAGANNGSSWTNAFTDLQDAIAASNAGDEIFVAQGTYMPAGPGGSLSASFNLKSDVAIRGGYAGVGAAIPDERDIEKYLTVLSGDLNRNDDEESFDLEDEWFHETSSRADNCDHVVNGSGTNANAVLDGFTIIGGHGEPYGGGMYNDNGCPTIVDCLFTENTALIGAGMFNTNSSSPALIRCTFERNAICYDFEGGGMVNKNNSNPTLTQCVFRENAALFGRGGGMDNSDSSPILTHCTFTANIALDASAMFNGGINSPSLSYCNFIDNSGRSAMRNSYYCDATLEFCLFRGNSGDFDSGDFDGGAIHNRGFSNIQLSNCQFIANSCKSDGGALYNYDNCSATVTNCLFSGNQAGETGGAVCNQHQCTTTLTNCTFRGNSAPNGKAVACSLYPYGYPVPISEPSNLQIANSILWDGDDEISILDGSTVTVFYNNVFGGWPGIGNINADPLFVDPNGPDNTSGTEDDNLRLLLGSPCIGAGDNSAVPPSVLTDLDGRPRIVGDTVDMGTYEFSGPIYVDDDAPNDPVPGNPAVSDPLENGTETHPFDAIQEAVDAAEDGYTVLVHQGSYSEIGTSNCIDFLGKNITLTSADPTDWDVVGNTIVIGYVQFSGTEDPNCKFTGFKIRNIEGAIYGNHTHATISHCNISGNGPCGATVIKDCDGIISNCLITDNITFFFCGVYPIVFGCNGLIKNCTIANNISGVSVGTATIENCIIYNNAGTQLAVNSGETLNISYCNLQGGLAGISGGGSVIRGPGNIDTDPCFIRSGYWEDEPWELIEGDYHLSSEGWRWNTDSKSWTYDYITSRCIDAGNPGSPLRRELMSVPRDPDNVWGINLRINMGAFGGTSQASMPPYDWALLADLNNDGTANFVDFAYQAQDWLKTAPEQPGDLNRDGVLNTMDLALLAQEWLKMTVWIE